MISLKDCKGPAEALERIGNARYRKVPVLYRNGDSDPFQYQGKAVVLCENDDGVLPVSTVGCDYGLLQPIHKLEMAYDIAEHHGGFVKGYTSFRGGKITTIEIGFNEEKPVGPDHVRLGFRLKDSYDGTGSATLDGLAWVKVCSNGMMGWGWKSRIAVPHRAFVHSRMTEALRASGYVSNKLKEILEHMNKLSETPLADEAAKELVKELIPGDGTRSDNIRQDITDRIFGGIGAETRRGTAWGFYNGITEYTTHVLGGKSEAMAKIGAGVTLERRALTLLGV